MPFLVAAIFCEHILLYILTNIFLIFFTNYVIAWMLVMGIMITMVVSQIPYYLPRPVKIQKWSQPKQIITAEEVEDNRKEVLC